MTLEEALEITDRALIHYRAKPLSDLERAVFQASWQELTYQAMVQKVAWQEKTLKDAGANLWKQLSKALGETVKKTDFKAALSRYRPTPVVLQDWGDAPCFTAPEVSAASLFFGREEELAQLQQWVEERCRLVAVLGMGGIGKTAVAVKLAERIQPRFKRLVWRSLRNAPPIDGLLTDLLKSLSNGQESVANTLDGKIAQLLRLFRAEPCLVVLDNLETLLQAGDRTGAFRAGWEGYGQLLETIADAAHQSCIVITSREQPGNLAVRQGHTVRVLQLEGLSATEGEQMLQAMGIFSGSQDDWQQLNQHYAGNPLALRIVAPTIKQFFNRNLPPFLALLKQKTCVFQGIRHLLDHQFVRLEALEKSLMFWLAIMREPVSLAELHAEVVPTVSEVDLFETLTSLQGRSLCIAVKPLGTETTPRFTQQPVVMQFVVDWLIDQVCEEIRTGNLSLFGSHALILAQTKDYVRDSQIRVILQPIGDQLKNWFGASETLTQALNQVLRRLHQEPFFSGYGAGNLLNLMHHLKLDLTGYDFSGLAVWQADLRNVKLHRVDFSRADLSKSMFAETIGYTFEVALSPDGELLATCDAASDVTLWQVATSQKLWTRKEHKGWVISLAFSPDGKTLASSGCDPTVRLWDVATGNCLQVLERSSDHLQRISFSPDGKLIASCSLDQTVRLWDVATGNCVNLRHWETDSNLAAILFTSVAFSPAGDILACCTFDYTIHLWEVQTGDLIRTLHSPERIGRILFTPDGLLMAGCDDGAVRLWNVQTGDLVHTLLGHREQVLGLAISPDGRLFASGSVDYTIRLWDSATRTCLRVLQGDEGVVWSLSFSPTIVSLPPAPNGIASISYTLVSGHEDRGVKFWDTHSGQCLKTLQGRSGWINSVTYSPIDSLLATTSFEPAIRLWNTQTRRCTQILRGHSNWIWNTAFSHDGQLLASAGRDGTARLWNVQTGDCLQILQGHAGWVWSVAFAPDDSFLVTCSYDKTIKLWDVKSGACLQTLVGHTSLVRSVDISSDGRTIASGGYENTVRLWDTATGHCRKTLAEHGSWVAMVALSPNGRFLASSSDDKTVRLWDVETGHCLQVLRGYTSTALSVCFSPDGQLLAGGCASEALRLWEVSTGKLVKVLEDPAHSGFASFSCDGKILAGSRNDEAVNLWNVETGDLLNILRYTQPYEGMKLAHAKGLTEAQTRTLQALGAIS